MTKLPNLLKKAPGRSILTSALIAGAVMLSNNAHAALDAQIKAFRATADATPIEDIVNQAVLIANQIGGGSIKLSNKNVKSLVLFAADAIINKPSPANATDPTDPNFVNRDENKADEIAEVAAYVLRSISSAPKFQKLGKAKKATVVLAQAALKTTKKTAQLFNTRIYRDVAGSIALTIFNGPGDPTGKLLKTLNKKAKKIAGKTNKAFFVQGLAEGFSATPPMQPGTGLIIYEDGNMPLLAQVNDPETDFRPL